MRRAVLLAVVLALLGGGLLAVWALHGDVDDAPLAQQAANAGVADSAAPADGSTSAPAAAAVRRASARAAASGRSSTVSVPGDGSLTILVLTPDGTPAEGATVTTLVRDDGPIDAQTRAAGADGRLRFDDLDLSGAEALIATHGLEAVAIVPRPDASSGDVVIRLGPALRVTGRVERIDGTPIVGATCELLLPGEEPVHASLGLWTSGTAGSVGFPPIPVPASPGQVTVRVTAPGLDVAVAPVRSDGSFVARVGELPTIRGRCVDERGDALPRVNVYFQEWESVRADDDGRFSLVLGPDDRLLTFDSASHAPRTVEFVPEGRTIDLGDVTLPGGASISGTVIDGAARPLPGVRVTASVDSESWRRSSRTRPDGSFRVVGLPPDAVLEVTADAPGAESEGWARTWASAVAGDEDVRVVLESERLALLRFVRAPDGRPAAIRRFSFSTRRRPQAVSAPDIDVDGLDAVCVQCPAVGAQTLEVTTEDLAGVRVTTSVRIVAAESGTTDVEVRLAAAPGGGR